MTFMPKFQPSAAELSHALPHALHASDEAALLDQQSHEGLSQRLAMIDLSASESRYKSRLEAELNVLKDFGLCGYYLIVADYVRWAKNNGIAVGPGRGSGPCSLVGFALGITNVDPIRYALPFERFVNPEYVPANKELVPDFDLDFCAERSGDVAAYIQAKYGNDKVAYISADNDETTPLPARLVIADRPLDGLVPTYREPRSGFLATKLNRKQIANAGLVQFNVINQKAISVLQNLIQALAKSNTDIDINNIDLNDKTTYQWLSTGETPDIDVFDTDQYTKALRTVKPSCFEELYAVVALCYPPLKDALLRYVENRNNPKRIDYIHPALESITAETYGIVLYQEQLMHITKNIAGFSMAQGDLFRRALRHGNPETVSVYENQFIDGAMQNGFSNAEAITLFEHIASAGRNTFNKSHAIAYAMLAYQIGWLKANHS